MMKKIVLLTLGTRGDVQPYVALGVGLKNTGYSVRLVAPEIFASLAREQGLEFVPVPFNPQDELQKPEIQALLRNGLVLLNVNKIVRYAQHLYRQIFEAFWQASDGAHLIVASSLAYGAQECGEKRKIPVVSTHLAPLSPTQAFSNFFLTAARPLGRLNRLTHWLMEQVSWQSVRSAINAWRKEYLDLPVLPMLSTIYQRTRASGAPILYAFSPSLIAKPDDWGAQEYVTGYWFLDTPNTFQPPLAVKRFLDEGPTPIVIGFGSMSEENQAQSAGKICAMVKHTGQRSIVLSGGSKINHHTTQSEQILWHDHLPHDWLFKKASAVVHHGGAGTTGATLRAGLPSLIVPFMLDQFAWAEIIQQRGLGLKSRPLRTVSIEALAESINRLLNSQTIRSRAETIGRKIADENGVARAVEILRSLL